MRTKMSYLRQCHINFETCVFSNDFKCLHRKKHICLFILYKANHIFDWAYSLSIKQERKTFLIEKSKMNFKTILALALILLGLTVTYAEPLKVKLLNKSDKLKMTH